MMRFIIAVALAGCGDPVVGAECAEGFTQSGNACVAVEPHDGGVSDGDLPDGWIADGDLPDGYHRGDAGQNERDGSLGDGSIPGDGSAPGDGSVLPGDGSVPPIDGSVLPMDGAVVPMDGAIVRTDGAVLPMDGAVVPSDGSYPDGYVPDASVPCDLGELMCGGRCIRPESDPEHCGECFNACDPGDVCVSGTCMPVCPDGLISCGPLCIDPMGDDPDNCGGCGIRCASGLCVDGMCVEGTPGHIVIIGHDYETTRAGMNQVAGNSVFLASGAPVRVLVYEGSATSRAIAGVDRAINQVATDRGRSWTRAVATAAGLLVELRTADVFVVYAQSNASDAELIGLGGDWRIGLGTFLRRGGVVVVFETPSEDNAGTYQLLDAAGLFTATAITDVSGDAVDLVSAVDGVALGVPVRYRGETSTVWFSTPATEVVVRHADGPVVLHRIYAP